MVHMQVNMPGKVLRVRYVNSYVYRTHIAVYVMFLQYACERGGYLSGILPITYVLNLLFTPCINLHETYKLLACEFIMCAKYAFQAV
jgi:hypothetical protein